MKAIRVGLMGFVLSPLMSYALAPDFTVVVNNVDFGNVIVGILSVCAALVVIYVVMFGIRMLNEVIFWDESIYDAYHNVRHRNKDWE